VAVKVLGYSFLGWLITRASSALSERGCIGHLPQIPVDGLLRIDGMTHIIDAVSAQCKDSHPLEAADCSNLEQTLRADISPTVIGAPLSPSSKHTSRTSTGVFSSLGHTPDLSQRVAVRGANKMEDGFLRAKYSRLSRVPSHQTSEHIASIAARSSATLVDVGTSS
jgi:hypothetical protein